MTWEIAVGIFTMLAAFISVITAAVKINRAIVLLCCVLLYKFRESKVARLGMLTLFIAFSALILYHLLLMSISHYIIYGLG